MGLISNINCLLAITIPLFALMKANGENFTTAVRSTFRETEDNLLPKFECVKIGHTFKYRVLVHRCHADICSQLGLFKDEKATKKLCEDCCRINGPKDTVGE